MPRTPASRPGSTRLDSLTLLVATSPVWTALLWRGQRRWLLAGRGLAHRWSRVCGSTGGSVVG
jgi:hypothetical protein